MFDDIPLVSPLRGNWVCSRCGCEDQARIHPDLTRPAVDPRYAIGYCDDCTPAKRGVRGVTRERVHLVHARHWDRQEFLAQQAAKADAKLMHRYRHGHLMTEDDLARVKELVRRQDGGT